MSAATGGAALRVFRKPHGPLVVTTRHSIDEVREHIGTLARRVGIPAVETADLIAAMPVRICELKEYEAKLPQARSLIAAIDPDDVDLLALALWQKIPVWSNDSDFANLGVEVWTTARLLKRLERKG